MDKLQVFFDGQCPLCTKEIKHYETIDVENRLELIDISRSDFDETLYGLEGRNYKKYFHVRTANGETLEGLEAFKNIWTELNCFKFLNKFSSLPGVRSLGQLAYLGFAEIRPYLPKKEDCGDGVCHR